MHDLDETESKLSDGLEAIHEEINSLSWNAILSLLEKMQTYLRQCVRQAPPSIHTDMKRPSFYHYHHSTPLKEMSLDDPFLTEYSSLRTQSWFSQLEEEIRLTGTFVSVSLPYIPRILDWAKSKGYKVKYSQY